MPTYKQSGGVPYVHQSFDWGTYGTPPGEYIAHLVTRLHCCFIDGATIYKYILFHLRGQNKTDHICESYCATFYFFGECDNITLITSLFMWSCYSKWAILMNMKINTGEYNKRQIYTCASYNIHRQVPASQLVSFLVWPQQTNLHRHILLYSDHQYLW